MKIIPHFARLARARHLARLILSLLFLAAPAALRAQVLWNIDFGVGSHSAKTGFAATGQSTNDFWNLYRHYDPKYVPGTPLVYGGSLQNLKAADGTESPVSISVTNAPGVWGNSSGDPMYDTYLYAQNGSNITVTIQNLDPGRYHFYLYGHADADVIGEQNSLFTLRSGTNTFGPAASASANGWKSAAPWREGFQFVVFRDVPVSSSQPVTLEVDAGVNGVPVLNGLQISSRGTSPPRLITTTVPEAAPAYTNLIFKAVHYEGTLSDQEARFDVQLTVESLTTNTISAPVFQGQLALVAPEIPDGLRLLNRNGQFRLEANAPGAYQMHLNLVAKIDRQEPWNQISFTGPPAAIASVDARGKDENTELQLLSGTPLQAAETHRTGAIRGFLGADHALRLRWKSKVAEVTHRAFATVDTTATAQVTPTVVKFETRFHYQILQSSLPALQIALPGGQMLTRLEGPQIRDWQVQTEGERQVLHIEFIKPVEKDYSLALFTEQGIDTTPLDVVLTPPQPLGMERESGSFTISAEDMQVEIASVSNLRQVNAPAGALASYHFYGRPCTLAATIKKIEPVLTADDRVEARLEESRLLVSHRLMLQVEKAGIYSVDLQPQPGLAVTELKGEGVEDWAMTDGILHVSFASRLLGERQINVQLEQPFSTLPDKLSILPLTVAGATRQTAWIGAAAAAGLRVKTDAATGLRERPVRALPQSSDEVLAFRAEQADWQLALATEKLPARLVASIFDLVTVGDGLLGGSATIRYAIFNQGVQEFQVRLPASWKNIDFTGANIRRRDQEGDVWTIRLQDKAWGGYTLVVTYDLQFDPKSATLDLGGAHTVGTERESGHVVLTSAANLKLDPQSAGSSLRRIDPTELPETDRALVTRPILQAYQYTGHQYQLAMHVTRHEEIDVLDAVADRTQLTSVLTSAGQMLTQASFMVKNNDKQFQRFLLPPNANLWGCYVDGQPVKAEQDGSWLLVSLPRAANRDQAFAVDIKYAQQLGRLNTLFPHSLKLQAPKTDVPNPYSEWTLYVPPDQHLSGFEGNMTVARGTTYGWRDAWERFTGFYRQLWDQAGLILLGAILFGLVLLVLGAAIQRKGWSGAAVVVVALLILAVMTGMLLPSLAKSKAKAQRVALRNNLKQIGLAARLFEDEHNRPPASAEELKAAVPEKLWHDPQTGQRIQLNPAGTAGSSTRGTSIVAYSPASGGKRAVAYSDGSVAEVDEAEFERALDHETAQGVPADVGFAALPRAEEPAQSANTPAPMAGPVTATGALGDRQREAQLVPQAAAPAVTTAPAAPPVGGMQANGAAAGRPFTPAAAATIETNATAAGIRSIQIDIPRQGREIHFTKVLNVNPNPEPLTVEVSTMKDGAYRAGRSALQLLVFLAGLVLLWREWRRSVPNSSRMAAGAFLIIFAVGSLLLTVRLLHVLFILGFALLILAAVVWCIWKLWPRAAGGGHETPAASGLDTSTGGAPSTVSLIAWFFVLSLAVLPGRAESKAAPGSVPAGAGPADYSIVSATYEGTIHDQVAQLDVELKATTYATNQIVPLFGPEVAVESFSAQGEARLVREADGLKLMSPNPGDLSLKFKLAAGLGGDVTHRQLNVAIPAAFASRFTLWIDEPDADVTFPSAVALKRTSENNRTRVEAVLGAAGRLDLQWTPRMKRAAEVAATVFCQNATLVSFGGGVVHNKTVLDYQISQGEMHSAKIRLPAGHRLLRVDGDAIRIWQLQTETDHEVLSVELLKGVQPSYRLTIETEKALEQSGATTTVEVPHALDVQRETGLVGLESAEELALNVTTTRDLQRIDAAEFTRQMAVPEAKSLLAYRFPKPQFALAVQAEAVQPQIEAAVHHRFHVQSDQVQLVAQVDYTIKRASVFSLKLALPAGYRLESVTGGQIKNWNERTDAAPPLLEINFQQRIQGAYSLRLVLRRTFADLPANLEFAGVQPEGAHQISGDVAVSVEPGISLKTVSFDGLVEIPAPLLRDMAAARQSQVQQIQQPQPAASGNDPLLAYKLLPATPATGAWQLALATEQVESWVRAEVVNVLTVSETLLSGKSLFRYDIQNAPIKELRLHIPTNFQNVDITGDNIRRRDQTNGDWTIELQSKVRGQYQLTVNWEQPLAVTNLLRFEGVRALGVERETGAITVQAKPPLQVSPRTASEELVRADASELPDWAGVRAAGGAREETAVLSYRYLRPTYQLVLQVNRFEDAGVLEALVDSVQLTTVVADDGQMMTELTLGIRNNGRQYLELELPPKTTVWSAFVGGQAVRPGRRNGKTLLPLERTADNQAPLSVELTYVGTEPFPHRGGRVLFTSPKLDVPLKNARWDLYLPPDFHYDDFGGTMSEAEISEAVHTYSLSEYRQQETRRRAEQRAEVQSVLSNARSELNRGNVKGLNEGYSQARSRSYRDASTVQQLKQLEQDLKRVQSSNLIQAQQDYTMANSMQFGVAADQPAGQRIGGDGMAVNYDASIAELQWTKLQQAQELATAKVQPLRVNLPTRGVRLAFTQLLQTQPNQPMTVRVEAHSARGPSWFKRLMAGAGLFLLLWLAASVVLSKRPAR